MALIMKTRSEPVSMPGRATGFRWDAWYAANRKRLSEKRARRYRDDVGYREAALRRSREQRETEKIPVVDGYTISFSEMARQVNVTVWVLREWRRKDYFPEPHHREGRLWFKPEHISLLQSLQAFFVENGVRVGEDLKQQLEDLVALTYANW